jgi:hypothetical protein
MNEKNQKLLGSLAGVATILLIGYYATSFYMNILSIRKLHKEESESAENSKK